MTDKLMADHEVDLSGLAGSVQKACDKIVELRRKLAKAVEFIDRYAVHDASCAGVHPDRCNCGFEKAARELGSM